MGIKMSENINKIAFINKFKGINVLVIVLGEIFKEKNINNLWL